MPTITLQPTAITSQDTFISQTAPNANYGGSTLLQMEGGGAIKRSFVKFDLSTLPANISILSAVVTLTNVDSPTTGTPSITAYRITTPWFAGLLSGTTPPPGSNGSTWNLRNHNGSVPYSAGPGGDIGPAIGSQIFSLFVYGGPNNIDITAEVNAIYHGTVVNEGWAFMTSGAGLAYNFASSNHGTPASRPKLVITYASWLIAGVAVGSSTVTGRLTGHGGLSAALSASSSWFAQALQPGKMASGLATGVATVTGTLRATGRLVGAAAGTSTAVADLTLYGNLASGTAAGTSTATGRLIAYEEISGLAEGIATATGRITMVGHLRGLAEGSSQVTGLLWGNAIGKVVNKICDNIPLLYITDGTYLPNGQLDRLNLLDAKNGFLLREWNPALAQYKSGGYFSDSAIGNGRRLSRRVFENAIEVMTLALMGYNQDNTIRYSREYLRWQELAADYWTSDWAIRPVYVVARGPRETETRYAVIHVMSIAQFANPYSQPFFSMSNKPSMGELSLRIEREPWMDVPPGEAEVVPISSIRSWTVAGWVSS